MKRIVSLLLLLCVTVCLAAQFEFTPLITQVNATPAGIVCGTDVAGDLDGDSNVNNKDVEYLLWHTLFPGTYPISQNADFNGDDAVNNKDVEYLLWHTLFPDTYPLTGTGQPVTLEQFLDIVGGFWIYDDSVRRMSKNEASFVARIFTDNVCTLGIYPGDLDRPGAYEAFRQVSENTFELDLLYEAEANMEEVRKTLTVILAGDGKMKAKFTDTNYQNLTYGGKNWTDAHQVALGMLKPSVTITPTTRVIAEYDDYRIIRLDHSAYNQSGQLLVEQYYDYVELTDTSAAAQKINAILLPPENIFFSAEDLSDFENYVEPGYPFENTYVSKVTFLNDKWLCVTTTSGWYMGGVYSDNISGKVFDMPTGDQVTLRAFAGDDPDAFEKQLKDIVYSQIPREDVPGILSGYTLDTFNFSIPDGQIVLYFPEYVFASWAVTIETGIYVA